MELAKEKRPNNAILNTLTLHAKNFSDFEDYSEAMQVLAITKGDIELSEWYFSLDCEEVDEVYIGFLESVHNSVHSKSLN